MVGWEGRERHVAGSETLSSGVKVMPPQFLESVEDSSAYTLGLMR